MKLTREIKAARRLSIFLWERKYISERPATIRRYKRAAHKVMRHMGKKLCALEG